MFLPADLVTPLKAYDNVPATMFASTMPLAGVIDHNSLPMTFLFCSLFVHCQHLEKTDFKELVKQAVPDNKDLICLKTTLPGAIPKGTNAFKDWCYDDKPTPLHIIPYW